MTSTNKPALHYAWVVLAAACVLNIFARADQGSFGVFVDPLVQQFGWKRGDISFAYSLAFLVGLPTVVVMGWLGDRFGARKLMLGAAVLIGTGTILMGTIEELWQFYAVYGFMVGSMGHAAFSVLLPVIVTRWFYHRLGIAMGIYFASQGLGPVIFAPLFRWLLETRGWHHTFTLIGVALMAILAFFALFIHNSPASKGLKPYGAEDLPEAPVHPAAAGVPKVSLREILRLPIVWKLTGIHFIGCVAHASILAHAWVFYLFAVVFGLCYGGEMVGFPIINKQVFGARAPLGSIYAFQMVGAGTGMALGGWLGGGLFDLSGHYTWALAASLAIGLSGLPLALGLPGRKKATAELAPVS